MPCRGELSDLWKQCELESQKKKNPVLVDLTLQRALSNRFIRRSGIRYFINTVDLGVRPGCPAARHLLNKGEYS